MARILGLGRGLSRRQMDEEVPAFGRSRLCVANVIANVFLSLCQSCSNEVREDYRSASETKAVNLTLQEEVLGVGPSTASAKRCDKRSNGVGPGVGLMDWACCGVSNMS